MSNIAKFESPTEAAHTERTVLNPREVADMLDREKNRARVVSEVNGKPVTHGELSDAFDLVADPENWKNPIDARIENPGAEMRALIAEAVVYFTGSTAHFRRVIESCGKDTFHITAKGYYLTIGA